LEIKAAKAPHRKKTGEKTGALKNMRPRDFKKHN